MKFTVKNLAQHLEGLALTALPDSKLHELNVYEGEHVAIVNDSFDSVVRSAVPTNSQHDQSVVALDEATRKDLGVEAGDTVNVQPLDLPDLGSVVVEVAGGLPEDSVVLGELRQRLKGRAVRAGESFEVPLHSLDDSPVSVTVIASSEDGLADISDFTELSFASLLEEDQSDGPREARFEDIGGLDEPLRAVREVIEPLLTESPIYNHLGATPPSGILLHGPPGTGKTLIGRAVASEVDAHLEIINGPELFDKFFGESERKLRQAFQRAQEHSPAVVFIDELDAIGSSRDGEYRPHDSVITQLLTLLDGLESDDDLVVMGSTNRVDDLDEALRRPGRFDREIEISAPDQDGRKEILEIHTRETPLADTVDLERYAAACAGFTGADLQALVQEAITATIRRTGASVDTRAFEDIEVTNRDFHVALSEVSPSALREYRATVPQTTWDEIGGQTEAKEALKEAIVLPQQHPELYQSVGLDSSSGILLYGPPGTGKTMLAKAAANASDANVLTVDGPELLESRVGKSEDNVRELFERARKNAPCIVFFDEFDAIAGQRGTNDDNPSYDGVATQLLTEFDGIEPLEDVVVVAATNRPDMIDQALLRPGRFDRHIHVDVPDLGARREILEIHTRDLPLAEAVDLEQVAQQTDEFTGADVAALCREASLSAVRRALDHDADTPQVKPADFAAALESVDAGERPGEPTHSEWNSNSDTHHPMFN
mgnify:FL=1